MYRLIFFFTSSLVVFCISCSSPEEKRINIAISKAKPLESYGNYSKWVKKLNPDANIINLYELGADSALVVLNKCSGLIVSGGADVYPEWYNRLADTNRCGNFDRYRDTLEIKLVQLAFDKKMPVLGICRGMQIINVALGGSLIIDIPTDVGTEVVLRQENWKNCFHEITIDKKSNLFQIVNTKSGLVNSNHHQCVSRLADGLKISSVAEDDVIESFEWQNSNNKSFLIGVQWHPERLDTVNSILSLTILDKFLRESYLYRSNRQ